jgi:hypothetical protein
MRRRKRGSSQRQSLIAKMTLMVVKVVVMMNL